MRIQKLSVVVLSIAVSCLGWAGCGGGGGSSTTTAPVTPPPATGPGNNLTAPTAITVAAGQTTSGVNIVVPPTAATFNVTLLGVNSPGATRGSASNVGGSVARGTTALILVFGTGLTGSETLAFSGPNDIAISGEAGIKATDGTPGIQFTIVVASGAAVGARTLNITSGNNASTFVGGLEVI